MSKFLKTTSLLLGGLVLIVVVAAIVLVTLVNPNTFKPIISAQVLKYTDRELTIDGDLSWTLFPYLGFKVGHMILHNPPAFQDKVFAEINQATVGVKLLPILHGNIQTNQIALSGLILHLIKNAKGTTNWQDLQNLRESSQHAESFAAAQASGKKMSLIIPSIEVEDSKILWLDEQTHQAATISHVELQAKDINQEHTFPINARFDFNTSNAVSGQAKLQGDVKLDLDGQLYAINKALLSLNAARGDMPFAIDMSGNVTADMTKQIVKVQQFKSHITHLKNIKSPLDVSAEVSANLNDHTITLANVAGQLANLELTGAMTINYQTTNLGGHLQTKPFDLKKFLQATGQDNPDLQDAKMMTANADFTATSPDFAALSLQGKIGLDELHAAKLTVSHLLMDANLKNRVLA